MALSDDLPQAGGAQTTPRLNLALFGASRSRQNLEFAQTRAQGEGAVVELEAARDAILIEIERKRIFRRGVARGFVEVGDDDRPATDFR